jgi:N6-adenosine-specific RNA methylase IME4/ParB-like chromosome segregation protein Spo0J
VNARAISDIRIGARHRKDMGDIDGLGASIREVGLLHPVVITPSGELVAGARRLAACEALGWTEIPVTEVNLAEIVRGELAENCARKDFLPSEMVAIMRTLGPTERVAARARMIEAAKVGKISTPSDGGKTRDKVAAYVGVSGRTLEKAAAVVAAAEAEPERFGKLLADMDRSGHVHAPFRRLNNARQAERIRAEPPPLPGRGPYRVIVADPPWPYELRTEDPSHRGVCPYPTMTIPDICNLGVAGIAHDDCILWLWTTNFYMRSAYEVLDAWGFSERTILTWAKPHFGVGDWLRGQTEHCILAARGAPRVTLTNESTLLMAPRGAAHSAKPEAFYELVERLCPAPRYAYLFARNSRPRWDAHGDEVSVTPASELARGWAEGRR